MDADDIIYISLLAFSILFGLFYRKLSPGAQKQWVGTVTGLFFICFVSGKAAFYPIFLVLFNIVIIKLVDTRVCHVYSFIASFGYLLFFRLVTYFGLPLPPAHTNAVQMMMTLKMVGVCFEIHDSWQLKKDLAKKKEDIQRTKKEKTATKSVESSEASSESGALRQRKADEASSEPVQEEKSNQKSLEEELKELQLRAQHESIEPSVIDLLHYAFNYCGVLTGPYYKYKVYSDMINSDVGSRLCTWQFCLQRIKWLPFYAVMFLLSSHYFPLRFATSSTLIDRYSLMYRVFYMTPVFFSFRMRLYSGFVLSECVCIMAGLGAYTTESAPKPGKGPTMYTALPSSEKEKKLDADYNFETIHNIDEYGSDFSPTVRGGMRCWNMTVQYWLAANVYKRMNAPKPLKEAVTMLTSAFWHGMHSGYYLSMLTVPFILMVEDFYARLIRKNISGMGVKVYDFITWFMKMQWFAYMGMAFLLLKVDTTITYWRSIGFLGHGIILILHTLAQFINLIRGKAKQKLQKSSVTARGQKSRLRVLSVPAEESAAPTTSSSTALSTTEPTQHKKTE